jgi:hypothetical protein
MKQKPRRARIGVAPAIAGAIIVGLMIAGTIPVTIDDAWLWALLVLFLLALS